MFHPYRRRARYVAQLRLALLDNEAAITHALLHTDRSDLNTQLAEFLLSEALWSTYDFMVACIEKNSVA